MGSVSGEDRSTAHEEKILVSVRLRPLNEIEVSENDESDWECINNTIISKSSERGMSSSAYNFDRVFGSDISTRQVYEEGAKNVALSALNGINASIFAYGQTSSGKTYTMSGITKYTLSDIFNYVDKHRSREFVLKFSALEIYNECVRDLLTSENTNLRLLDDPERGTVVERLTEFALRDWDQLKELLAFCETQRQIGETALNQMSSRSHQILRLTVESSTREYSTSHNSDSLTATVNFVDLAGSERVSQTMSEGTRLKEGCHINRSLLTLGTVIRKLSKGRNGHVPYRDSKLTRILQNSLGGNAKTAIICTLSPAHSHVEQSRNTLLFASCANQVTNRAQVNVVMSEKALVKLLQKELARLEKELRRLVSRSPGSCDSLSALREKERLIEKMDNEIRQLTQQRDYAHSCLQNLQLAELSDLYNSSREKGRAWLEDYPTSVSDINDPFRSEITSIASRLSDRYERIGSNKLDEFEKESYLSDDMTPAKTAHKFDSDLITEDICKEVQCVEVEGDKCSFKSEQVPSQHEVNAIEVDNIETSQIEAQDLNNTSDPLDISVTPLSDINIPDGIGEGTPEMVAEANKENIDELNHDNDKLEDREDKTETYNEENIDQHNDYSTTFTEDHDLKDEKSEDNSKNTSFPSKDEQLECLQHDENFDGSLECQKQSVDNPVSGAFSNVDKNLECQKQVLEDHVNEDENLDCHKLIVDKHISEDEILECQKASVDNHATQDENLQCESNLGDNPTSVVVPSITDNFQCDEEQSEGNDVLQMEPISENQQKPSDNDSEVVANSQLLSSTRSQDFERQRQEIIELWNVCNVPLIHRTYFFLLFNGEPSDSIYIEVEQRRLSYLKRSLCQSSEASSLRALQREREKLKRQMLKKYSSKERESLYENWGIDLKSKRRRLQLCCLLWTDTKDLEHIKESAALVSKLVGLVEPNHAPKEIFGLSLPSSTLCRANTWSGLPSLFGLT